MTSEEERQAEVMRRCDRFVYLHGRVTIAEELAALADYAGDRERDRYGEGALVEEVEHRVAGLLGAEAAVFLPSGTMAQQIALRVWADETGADTVALHGLSHLEIHELGATWELHGLRPRFLTREPRQPSVRDLMEISERLGAVTLELPLRAADFTLPTWEELSGFCAAARERGARVHIDGARLWESTGHLGHSLAEIAGLADSVYVSFYKTLGGMSGSALTGSATFVAAVRRWQHRHGGRLVTQYPAILGALRGLDRLLPRVPAYVAHATDLAARLALVACVRVNPSPPHCNAFVVYADVDTEAIRNAALSYAEERRVWPGKWFPTEVPGWSCAECVVGEATMGWTADEYAELIVELLDRAAPASPESCQSPSKT